MFAKRGRGEKVVKRVVRGHEPVFPLSKLLFRRGKRRFARMELHQSHYELSFGLLELEERVLTRASTEVELEVPVLMRAFVEVELEKPGIDGCIPPKRRS